MDKKVIYVDCQFFQTPAWDRGMGRYALSLLKTLYDLSDDTSFVLIFSTHLPKNIAAVQVIMSKCSKATIVELDLLPTLELSYTEAAKINKQILNDYLATQKAGHTTNWFMIPCLFQEPTACVFPDSIAKCLIYYDSIPLLYLERYMLAWNYENYMQRHVTLYEADKIFAISQTVADDLAVYYGMKDDGQPVINIDGACIEGMFEEFKQPAFDVPKRYILFSTSNDVRKNNEKAIEAFAKFRASVGDDYHLIITSTFPTDQRETLLGLADNIIFTDNVSEVELAWLYQHSQAVLFASEYEGLGLPILEAVHIGKKVACSNIPVFREISEDAFYFFDPQDINDIAEKLRRAVNGDGWAQKEKLYATINEHYTWARTAGLVRATLERTAISPAARIEKPKIAILAPTPDGYSAIGKVVQELHYSIAKHFDINYYFEDRKEEPSMQIRPNYLKYLVPSFAAEDFSALAYRGYDAVLYHIGNSEYHFLTILNALYLPGVAILHDMVLSEAFGEMARLGLILPERVEAELKLDEMVGATDSALLTSVVNNQIAGIAHSRYAKNALEKLVQPDGPVIIEGGLPVAMSKQNVQTQHRSIVHVGLAGILSSHKGLGIIEELARDESLTDKIMLHVFGFGNVDPGAVSKLKSHDNIRLTTNLSDLEYQSHLSDLDILVNYRSSYRGETSLAVLEAMRYGCVVLVNGKLGWFSELPDDCVAKVTSEDELLKAVKRLVTSSAERNRIGMAAKKYISNQHSPEAYSQLVDTVIRQASARPIGKRSEAARIAASADQLIELYKNTFRD